MIRFCNCGALTNGGTLFLKQVIPALFNISQQTITFASAKHM